MAEDGLLHTAELLKTALPYVDIRSRLALEVLVKLYELIVCIRNYKTNDISACGFEEEKVDMETLLNNIRPKCNENERSFVDKMLNIFQAKRMFEMYNTYMEAMKTMQGFEGFGGGDDEDASSSFMNNFKDIDFSSMFGDNFNADKFIKNYKNMVSDEGKDEKNVTSDYETYKYTDENVSEESQNYTSTPNNDIVDEVSDEYINSDNSSMFENLKAMIPPEQMKTFENLRMLFDSMSYDDNNKSDENED